MSTRKIIIDTDPGQDDAVAILLALASPQEVELLGLTCVAGNVPLDLTTRNARMVCELAGRRDIPIYAGCDRPMGRDLVTAEHVHGKTGLDGPTLPEPTMPLADGHAVEFLIESLRAAPANSLTLCPIGPLTNIATAFDNAPDIIEKVQEIVLMGGAYFEVGNITPTAEFNIYVDPQAAHIVFRSGVPITVMPLDVTHKALVTKPRNEAFRSIGNPVGVAAAEMTDFFERYDKEKYGSAGAPLHDPCTIAYLIKPELFSGRHVNVEIETSSELTMGMTVADWWGVTDRAPNALFMGDINADGFFALLTERLARLITQLTLAKPEHLDAVLRLVADFHHEEGIEHDDTTRRAAVLPLLEGSPHGAIYLAGPVRAPIGYVVVTFGWSLEFGGMDGFVDEIYIRPGVRGRGLGTELLSSMPNTLAETGMKALHLEVARGNTKARAIYEKMGFEAREDYVLMSRRF